MGQLESFFSYFNVILGTVFILIGFRIYKPFKKEKAEEMNKKYGTFYKLAGVGLIIWGLVKII